MSNAAHNWARPLDLSKRDKAVLLNLAERANAKTGRCWPCMKTIARETGYCVRAVRFALRYLEEQGLIRTLRQLGRRSIYWVLFGVAVPPPEPVQMALDLAELPRQEIPETAASDSSPPRNPVPGIQPSKSQPSGEPRESAHARAPAQDPPISRSNLPKDWQPSPLDIAFALACGLDAGVIADAFADHYRALGAVRADWAAAWRQWCRREVQFAARRVRSSSTGVIQQIRDDWGCKSFLAGDYDRPDDQLRIAAA